MDSDIALYSDMASYMKARKTTLKTSKEAVAKVGLTPFSLINSNDNSNVQVCYFLQLTPTTNVLGFFSPITSESFFFLNLVGLN